MSANQPETSVNLRECLKNGTLSLRDLDKKQKRRSSKGRRRRSKTKTGRTEKAADGDTTKTEAMEDSKNTTKASKITKSSKTTTVPKGRDLEMNTQHKESDEIVRSILDNVFDTVTRQCIAIEHSVANEQAHALAEAFMAAFDERVVFTRKFYMDQRRETQELLYRAAQENVKDLIIRATAQCNPSQDKEKLDAVYPLDFLRSADLDARMRAHVEQINAEKLAMKQIMYKTASEIVEDLFSCAANNASVQNVLETGVTYEEEVDSELPVRGWRRFLCCAKTNKLKKKNKKSGLLDGLRRLFSRR
ncbi:uncharacterized protein LOC133186817 [Saccostrea echinata]|uniref:uncharacterized protein LOC133186817 n=1 Tax=Saccostrea echinata TaxID=191078 RepID=UPI002A81C2D8|nr:uncharacterized protein LOC133186817 [Saccostrea echinata]